MSSEPSVCFDPVTNEEIPCEIGTGGGGVPSPSDTVNIAITELCLIRRATIVWDSGLKFM